MKKNLYKIVLVICLVLVIFTPMVSFAADCTYPGEPNCTPPSSVTTTTCAGTNGLGNIICTLTSLLNSIIPFLITLGLVYFIWGVVNYVIADGEEAKKAGRDRIIYGVIGLAVIVGVWGLVNIVTRTFNIGGQAAPNLSNLVNTTPVSSSACGKIDSGNSKFGDVLNFFTCVIGNSVIPLLFAVAIVSFIWGAIKFFIINADEEAKRDQGKQFMLWGIIALAVMISVWGLVSILGNTFGVDTKILPQVNPYKSTP